MTDPDKKVESTPPRDADITEVMRRRSRRGFFVLGLGSVAGFAGWEWLTARARGGGVPYPLRRVLEINEAFAARYFSSSRLARTYPRELAREPRLNGGEGMSQDFDPAGWRLRVSGAGEPREFTLDDIKRLPRTEMT